MSESLRVQPPVSVFTVGARGGVGTSTFTAALASAVTHDRLILVDADPSSAGLDLTLGIEDAPGARWHDLGQLDADVSIDELAGILPRWNDIPVLSHDGVHRPIAPATVATLMRACAVGGWSFLSDGGRRVDPHLIDHADHVVIVSGRDVRSAMWARSIALNALGDDPPGLHLVTTGLAAGVMTAERLTQITGVTHRGHVRPWRALPAAQERGVPLPPRKSNSLHVVAREVAAALEGPTFRGAGVVAAGDLMGYGGE